MAVALVKPFSLVQEVRQTIQELSFCLGLICKNRWSQTSVALCLYKDFAGICLDFLVELPQKSGKFVLTVPHKFQCNSRAIKSRLIGYIDHFDCNF